MTMKTMTCRFGQEYSRCECRWRMRLPIRSCEWMLKSRHTYFPTANSNLIRISSSGFELIASLIRELWNSKCSDPLRMAKYQRNRPWWLEDEGGICPACGQAYAYQTEYRCAACDGPICAMCVETTIEVEVCCVGCESTNLRVEATGA